MIHVICAPAVHIADFTKALTFAFIGPIALFAYCWRNGTTLGWYRGCGRDLTA